jgi:hypothetical protein
MLLWSPVPSGGFSSGCMTRPMAEGRKGAHRAHQKAYRATSGCLDLKYRFALAYMDGHNILKLWTASQMPLAIVSLVHQRPISPLSAFISYQSHTHRENHDFWGINSSAC